MTYLGKCNPNEANYTIFYHAIDGSINAELPGLVAILLNAPPSVAIVLLSHIDDVDFSSTSLIAALQAFPTGSDLALSLSSQVRLRKYHSEDLTQFVMFPSIIQAAALEIVQIDTPYVLFLNTDIILGKKLGLKLDFSHDQANTAPCSLCVSSMKQKIDALSSEEHPSGFDTDSALSSKERAAILHALPQQPLLSFDINSMADSRLYHPCKFSKPFGRFGQNCDIPHEIKIDYIASSIGLQLFDKAPLVSCLMATRHRLNMAQIAYQCFVNQTYPNRELVIVVDDDLSTASWFKALSDDRVRLTHSNSIEVVLKSATSQNCNSTWMVKVVVVPINDVLSFSKIH